MNLTIIDPIALETIIVKDKSKRKVKVITPLNPKQPHYLITQLISLLLGYIGA
jgi:hypothetical protein